MPSSTSFYLILLVYFFSLFIEGFHLDPLPEPLGSYMSGKNYNLFIKQEGVCFINAMHFYWAIPENIHTQPRTASIFYPPLAFGNSKMRYPPMPSEFHNREPPSPSEFPFFWKYIFNLATPI